VFFIDFITTI